MNEQHSILRKEQDLVVHDARMTRRQARPIASWAITMGLGGLVLGFVGATDSYELPLALRLGLWLGMCAVAGIIAITVERAATGSGLHLRNQIAWWAFLTTCLAVAMVPVIFLVNSTGNYSQFTNLPTYTLNSFAISATLVAFRLLIGTLLARSAPDTSTEYRLPVDGHNEECDKQEKTSSEPSLLRRLSPALQSAQLLGLKSEGHYLRVFTDKGSELILIRLKDAIDETSPVDGMQVHRSWWLARRAGIERRNKDGRIELKLDDETWVPVSRTHRSAWLKQDW